MYEPYQTGKPPEPIHPMYPYNFFPEGTLANDLQNNHYLNCQKCQNYYKEKNDKPLPLS